MLSSPVSQKVLTNGKEGGEKCFSHGSFNIPNLRQLKLLLLMNQDCENLPPDWTRTLKSLFKCSRFRQVV